MGTHVCMHTAFHHTYIHTCSLSLSFIACWQKLSLLHEAWPALSDLCFMNKGIGANECLSCTAWFTLCDLCFRNKGIGAMIARKARNIISRVRHKCFNTFHFTGFILSFSFIYLYYVFTVIKNKTKQKNIVDIRVHTIFCGWLCVLKFGV